MRKSHESSGRGFTLVELLAVMAIVALLIAALMPALQHARAQAMKVRCLANMRLHGVAFANYAGDWKQELPHSSRWTAGWGIRLVPYMISGFPAVPLSGAHGNAYYVQELIPGMRCPGTPVNYEGNYTIATYGMNRHMSMEPDENHDGVINNPERRNLEQIKLDPSRLYLAGDSQLHNPIPWQDMANIDRPTFSYYRAHDRAVTMLFADMHVESLRKGQRTDLRGVDRRVSGGLLGYK